MGCAASCVDTTMSLFGRQTNNDSGERAQLERKLYIAKETPEPVFDLTECYLREVPSGVYSICKVYRKELLYLNNNKLASLEHGGNLSDLYLLRVLNISFNNFTQLPSDIKYLVSVTELYLQNNQIKILPESIQFLENLQILDVSNNRLKSLTPSLGHLKNLKVLKIKSNFDLCQLCPELCQANNINTIELNGEQYQFPPSQIAMNGTESIMRYLCENMGIQYVLPSYEQVDAPVAQSSNIQSPFTKNSTFLWEEQEAADKEQENKFHLAAKLHREKILSKVLQDQSDLDAEIAKVQEAKDTDRSRLIKEIQEDEIEIENMVKHLIQSVNLHPEVIQQQLQHENDEHDRLLQIIRQNNDNVRKTDVLKAMELMIDENFSVHSMKRNYQDLSDNVKQNMLVQELENTQKLEQLYKAKDQSRTYLIHQLVEDQDIQKAVVASLVERVDARSWSLNQEISLISSNLAKLSVIEQEKKKLNVVYNFNELLHQRTQLLHLLDDLQAQQSKRRAQLVATMKELDSQKDSSTDFWLKNYQKVVESAPKSLLGIGKNLDPLLANYLLQEGVIHCLPFLFKFLFSNESILNITFEKLKENGVTLISDKEGIMRAIQFYVSAKSENHNCVTNPMYEPSAPKVVENTEQSFTGVVETGNVNTSTVESECVVCMDARCEVVFVPCGHLCCCLPCSDKDMDLCPMCRGNIEKRMKIILP